MRLAALEGQGGEGFRRMEGTAAMDRSAPSPRLTKAAHEFEGQMMKELLTPLTSGDALTGEDDSDAGVGSSGALSQFASDALGQALSVRGGFGIADRIVHELSHSGKPSGTGKVTGSLHQNTANQTNE